jgi:hypothetical protein
VLVVMSRRSAPIELSERDILAYTQLGIPLNIPLERGANSELSRTLEPRLHQMSDEMYTTLSTSTLCWLAERKGFGIPSKYADDSTPDKHAALAAFIHSTIEKQRRDDHTVPSLRGPTASSAASPMTVPLSVNSPVISAGGWGGVGRHNWDIFAPPPAAPRAASTSTPAEPSPATPSGPSMLPWRIPQATILEPSGSPAAALAVAAVSPRVTSPSALPASAADALGSASTAHVQHGLIGTNAAAAAASVAVVAASAVPVPLKMPSPSPLSPAAAGNAPSSSSEESEVRRLSEELRAARAQGAAASGEAASLRAALKALEASSAAALLAQRESTEVRIAAARESASEDLRMVMDTKAQETLAARAALEERERLLAAADRRVGALMAELGGRAEAAEESEREVFRLKGDFAALSAALASANAAFEQEGRRSAAREANARAEAEARCSASEANASRRVEEMVREVGVQEARARAAEAALEKALADSQRAIQAERASCANAVALVREELRGVRAAGEEAAKVASASFDRVMAAPRAEIASVQRVLEATLEQLVEARSVAGESLSNVSRLESERATLIARIEAEKAAGANIRYRCSSVEEGIRVRLAEMNARERTLVKETEAAKNDFARALNHFPRTLAPPPLSCCPPPPPSHIRFLLNFGQKPPPPPPPQPPPPPTHVHLQSMPLRALKR